MSASTEKGSNILTVAKKKRHMYLLEKLQRGKSLSVSELKELEAFEGKPLLPGVVRTQREVAESFHVSKRAVENWVSDGMPRTEEGYYSLLDIVAWKENKNKKKTDSNEPDWDADYRKHKAKLAKIEYDKKIGDLISLEDVEAGRVARILAVKQSLLAFPRAVAPILAVMNEPRDIQNYLNNKIREIISQFAGQDPQKNENKITKKT